MDGACVRAKKGISDRAEAGRWIAASPARRSTLVRPRLKPLVMAITAIRSRRGPRRRKPAKPHADKAYDQPELRRWVSDRGQPDNRRKKPAELLRGLDATWAVTASCHHASPARCL